IAAMDVLTNGTIVTVDANNGIVYEGKIDSLLDTKTKNQPTTTVNTEFFAPTATQVMMNLGNPDLAQQYASLPADGIGLMREE
ncbi:hypothetical protein MMA87_24700, partial [Salmonella enterica]|nr:hypothetical protein [Salmonella enterica]